MTDQPTGGPGGAEAHSYEEMVTIEWADPNPSILEIAAHFAVDSTGFDPDFGAYRIGSGDKGVLVLVTAQTAREIADRSSSDHVTTWFANPAQETLEEPARDRAPNEVDGP